jgi:3-dehydroquinate synthetase
MLAAARVGAALGSGDPALEARLGALLPRLGLPVDLDRRIDPATLARVGVDKKRVGHTISFIVVEAPGRTRVEKLDPAQLEILLRTR